MLSLLRYMVRTNLSVKLWKKEKETHVSFAITPQTTEVIGIVCDKSLVKMEKELYLYVEGMSRKHVPNESNMLHQKALNEDFSKGSLGTVTPRHLLQVRED